MFPPHNIFKVQSNGSLRWMESATDLERAKALLKGLAAFSHGEYVITDLKGDETEKPAPFDSPVLFSATRSRVFA